MYIFIHIPLDLHYSYAAFSFFLFFFFFFMCFFQFVATRSFLSVMQKNINGTQVGVCLTTDDQSEEVQGLSRSLEPKYENYVIRVSRTQPWVSREGECEQQLPSTCSGSRYVSFTCVPAYIYHICWILASKDKEGACGSQHLCNFFL